MKAISVKLKISRKSYESTLH